MRSPNSMFTISEIQESNLGTPVDTAEETDTGYRFTINAAGFKKDEINISTEGKVVSVEGTSTRFKNKLNCYFTAPRKIDTAKIEAVLEDGVLEISVPFLVEPKTSVKVVVK
jgi:HSP20 family molecular chaperone IbpA